MSQTLECPNCGAAIDYDPDDDPVVDGVGNLPKVFKYQIDGR